VVAIDRMRTGKKPERSEIVSRAIEQPLGSSLA
jgi:hypothetical protein